MNYRRGIAGGLLGALLACVLWIAFLIGAFAYAIVRAQFADFGGGALIIEVWHLLVAAGVGFAAGFYWRGRHPQKSRRR